jgi:hypothetical protein
MHERADPHPKYGDGINHPWTDGSLVPPVLCMQYTRPIVVIDIAAWNRESDTAIHEFKHATDTGVTCSSLLACNCGANCICSWTQPMRSAQRDSDTGLLLKRQPQKFAEQAFEGLRATFTPRTIYLLYGWNRQHYNLVDFRDLDAAQPDREGQIKTCECAATGQMCNCEDYRMPVDLDVVLQRLAQGFKTKCKVVAGFSD